MNNKVATKTEGNSLTIERVFDAPQDVVFNAFSDPEILTQWWSPEGFTIPVSKMNFEVGGTWHYMMLGGPDMGEFAGMEAWGLATYKEIEPTSKIVWEDAFTDETGVPNTQMPVSTQVTMFIEEGEKTRVVTTGTYENEEAVQTVMGMGMIEGLTSAYEKLDEILAQVKATG